MLRRRSRAPHPAEVQRPHAFAWMLATLALVMLPHIPRMPIWVTGAAAVFGLWRLLHDQRGWPLPAGWLRLILAIATLAMIVATYGTPTGRQPGIALLIVLVMLKLLETRNHRDVMVVTFLAYFLVVTNFFYTQTIPMLLYMVLVVMLITATLIHFNHTGDVVPKRVIADLRTAGVLTLQGLPLMVVLFIFFPRVSGPLWGLPSDAHGGLTGLSEEMSPGQIGILSQDDSPAFRVEFEGDPPALPILYWRGPVLWDYDGYTWTTSPEPPLQGTMRRTEGQGHRYTVTLEPHGKRWLFALDHATTAVLGTREIPLNHAGIVSSLGSFTSDYQLHAHQEINERRRYTLVSHTRYRTVGLSGAMRHRALRVSPNIGEKVHALARGWRERHGEDRAVVDAALRYFNQQPFVYTLTPPLLERNPTEEFLFDSRRGYCEHYASAFTVLMRAAGIPARVVTGYQGGALNPLGDYVLVRQRDAHAWSEVWLQGEGWVRVDPTGAVAPERIELGLTGLAEYAADPLIIRDSALLSRAWHSLRLGWDAINNSWNKWVLGYDPKRQVQLMREFGLSDISWRGLTILMLIGVGVFVALFAWRVRPTRRPTDQALLIYRRFCRKLARRGLVRAPTEGPADFAARVVRDRPDLAAQVARINVLYTRLRYGTAPEEQTDRLRREVRAFHP